MSASSKLPKVETQTLQARVYETIKKAIISGHFAPGEQVTIRKLASDLGTSPMPVREAVHRLVSEKALEMRSARALRVPILTKEKLEDLIRVRTIVEPEAVALATRAMPEEDIENIENLNRKLVKAINRNVTEQMLSANRALHFTIYEAAGSPLLLQVIDGLWLQSGPYLQALFSRSTNLQEALGTEHIYEEMVDAFKARDARRAKKIRERDIRQSYQWFLEHEQNED